MKKTDRYIGFLTQFKKGFKATIRLDGYSRTVQWYETAEQAITATEQHVFANEDGAQIDWLPTVDRRRKVRKSKR